MATTIIWYYHNLEGEPKKFVQHGDAIPRRNDLVFMDGRNFKIDRVQWQPKENSPTVLLFLEAVESPLS